MADSLPSSVSLRAGLLAAGRSIGWDSSRHISAGYSPHDVKTHCVENAEWQKVRLSLKGKDTVEKIEVLEAYWDKQMQEAETLIAASSFEVRRRGYALEWATEVQVGNYLGALRRGGQLDNNNLIRKAR